MNVKKTVKLICVEAGVNSNKFWTGVLYDNNDVECKWGRVGNTPQSKYFAGKGEQFLRKKEAEKRKGKIVDGERVYYTDLHIVEADVGSKSVVVDKGNINQAAKRDIDIKDPKLHALVDRLISSNIHTITSSTSITYSSSTGLFSTPLGVVTRDAISRARLILADIKKNFNDRTVLNRLVSDYLRLVPHNIGMKFRIENIFPNDDQAIKDEMNILDSLESSYDALHAQPADDTTDKTVEKVFDVMMDIIKPGSKEWDRVVDKFVKSNKSMHGYVNKRVVNIYDIDIGHMTKQYDKKIGNDIEVYHGTSEANLLSILKGGLKCAPPSTAYIAGKMFGNGVYGTETASKSLGYTFGRWGGNTSQSGWMFMCDFAMGTAYYPTAYGMRSLPSGYDSCWALPSKTGLHNDELIVYKNSQVQIKRLLEIR